MRAVIRRRLRFLREDGQSHHRSQSSSYQAKDIHKQQCG
jgi:hypothetical protein